MHANKREEVKSLQVGDIACILGLNQTATGDTLTSQSQPVLLEPLTYPDPVISVAIEPKTVADQDRLNDALAKIADEDPTFHIKQDEETGQTIISGMGELHLEVIVDRVLREYGVKANVGKPQVTYRETISVKNGIRRDVPPADRWKRSFRSSRTGDLPQRERRRIRVHQRSIQRSNP